MSNPCLLISSKIALETSDDGSDSIEKKIALQPSLNPTFYFCHIRLDIRGNHVTNKCGSKNVLQQVTYIQWHTSCRNQTMLICGCICQSRRTILENRAVNFAKSSIIIKAGYLRPLSGRGTNERKSGLFHRNRDIWQPYLKCAERTFETYAPPLNLSTHFIHVNCFHRILQWKN